MRYIIEATLRSAHVFAITAESEYDARNRALTILSARVADSDHNEYWQFDSTYEDSEHNCTVDEDLTPR